MAELIIYALFAALLVGLTVFGALRAVGAIHTPRRCVVLAIIAWLAALFFMTVRPGSGAVRVNLVPLEFDGRGSVFDAILNTFVFLPLGILLATLGWRLIAALAVALAVSLTIEVTQYLADWGRTADVNDLITNVLGAAIGWAAGWAFQSARARRPSLD